jgi:hypothetical protein
VARKGENRPIFEGETPPKKCPPNIGADIGAITGILLTGSLLYKGSTFGTPEYCPSIYISPITYIQAHHRAPLLTHVNFVSRVLQIQFSRLATA